MRGYGSFGGIDGYCARGRVLGLLDRLFQTGILRLYQGSNLGHPGAWRIARDCRDALVPTDAADTAYIICARATVTTGATCTAASAASGPGKPVT